MQPWRMGISPRLLGVPPWWRMRIERVWWNQPPCLFDLPWCYVSDLLALEHRMVVVHIWRLSVVLAW